MKISELKNKHAGETAWIIGRGISLKNLAASDIGDGFVIAINQSIAQVDALSLSVPVYSMYAFGCEVYDLRIKSKPHKCVDEIVMPKDAPILINDGVNEGGNCLLDYPKRYGYMPEQDFNCPQLFASGATSIFIAKYLGATEIKMLCFDSYTDMDLRAVNEMNNIQKTDAAYIGQRMQIDHAIKKCGIPVSFINLSHKKVYADNDNGVLIGTPVFDGKTYWNYTYSLACAFAGFSMANIPIDVLSVAYNRHIDDARNYIFTLFLESPYKKLFFIDSDIGWNFKDFLDLYMLDVDFVGGSYPFRNKWDEFTATLEEPRIENSGLWKASAVPTGFLCLTKKACKQIVKAYPQYYREKGRAIYDVFQEVRENGTRYGEDFSFCKKYARIGGEMWVSPDCTFTHIGDKSYTGNLKQSIEQKAVKLESRELVDPIDREWQQRFEKVWDNGDYRLGSTGQRMTKYFLGFVPPEATLNCYGSGSGREVVEIRKTRKHKINMVDIATNAMETACKTVMDESGGEIKFYHSSLDDLSMMPKAEWGYCANVLMTVHPDKLDGCLKEIKRTSDNCFIELYSHEDTRLGIQMTTNSHSEKWWIEKLSTYWKEIKYFSVPMDLTRHIFVCSDSALSEKWYGDLDALFDLCGSDKGNVLHKYGKFYEKKLSGFNGNKLKLLEIGLSRCSNGTQSLDVWSKYFKNVDIVGYDLTDLTRFSRNGVAIVQGDQGDTEHLKRLDEYGNFDIIIDDGSHESADQLKSFEYLYPKLNKNGVYFIEDIMTPRNDAFVNRLREEKTGLVEYSYSQTAEHKIVAIGAKP